MSSLPPTASTDEIEEELVFLEVLISTLDAGADDYAERLAPFQAQKEDLERRLAGSQGGSRPQTSHLQQNHMHHMPDMDGVNESSNGWFQTILNDPTDSNGGQPNTSNDGWTYNDSYGMGINTNLNNGSGPYSNHFGMRTDSNLSNTSQSHAAMGEGGQYTNNFGMGTNMSLPNRSLRPDMSFHTQPNPMKRTLPYSLQQSDSSQHPSKRPTPEPSNVASPASSTDSFEFLDNPAASSAAQLSERSIQRQREAEKALRDQRERQLADEQFARALNHPTPSFACSTSRPGIQTTLNPNGTFQRPQRPIKQEPGLPMQQQGARGVPEVVDLTNSDDEEEVSEVPSTAFTPNSRTENRHTRPMPGTFPTVPNGYQSVYGNNSINTPAPRYPWMQHNNPLVSGAMSAVSGIRNVASSLGDTFEELNNLVNGRFRQARPWDDDVVYGGSRQINADPYAGYSDMDLYNQRRSALEHYDPLKTTEEITKLLENIRPDEDMPAHLRVQTPEAMAVKLHKYQELGLTWLQQREESSNHGGILADDMVSPASTFSSPSSPAIAIRRLLQVLWHVRQSAKLH